MNKKGDGVNREGRCGLLMGLRVMGGMRGLHRLAGTERQREAIVAGRGEHERA